MTRHPLLRPVLLFDAATCLAMGGLLVAAAGPIAGLTDLPEPLLREAGILLFPFALFVLWAARRGAGWPARTVASANLGWVAASLAAILWTAPNAFGIAFVAAQALAVAGIAALQLHALGARAQRM
ncbi:hypothetical protein FHS95_001332 [Sphingomonas naasensis]|uniref:Uncharacterized protein n=1 Tax=Sphingomonas naasensis TaxID=1344951 RepID=A0A4S1W9T3_9SPHN|nr:hypothetical protein [Sphingomonas naasensis]NIJ19663.1 hypothetical protein [Sphingomonas naasensis]TGX37266.1 hypothetical protein E5A74_20175 [Sphingomonas naasensis]